MLHGTRCARRQETTRLDELAFAMFVRLHDLNTDNYDSEEMKGILRGIKNNLPHLMPSVDLRDEVKIDGLAAHGLDVPQGIPLSQIPMVAIPEAIDIHVDRYARKLAAALYYREKGHALREEHMVWTQWSPPTNNRARDTFVELMRMTPSVTLGTRINLSMGDRFGYRSGTNDTPDIFAALAQFGRGLLITMMVSDQIDADLQLALEGWVRAQDLLD